jgi:hypothetical protein
MRKSESSPPRWTGEVVGSDEASPRARFLGSGSVEVVQRMAGGSRGGLRPSCGSMPVTCRAGARDRSTGCRRGEVGVEEHVGDRSTACCTDSAAAAYSIRRCSVSPDSAQQRAANRGGP